MFVFVIARRVCTSPCFVFVTTLKVLVEVFGGLAVQQIVVFCEVFAVFANLMRCSSLWIHHFLPVNVWMPDAFVGLKSEFEVLWNVL